jgi:hypothetical protein
MMEGALSARTRYLVIIAYSVSILVLYSLPVSLQNEWYNIFSYLGTHKALPYIDTREGYPPLGLLVYMPLYALFKGNENLFFYALRAVNGAFLVGTFFVLYSILNLEFGEKKSLTTALYYATLPSVIMANTYSNDIISLLPAALAIYMMLKKKPALSGLFIALGTLGKGYPILLVIPALFMFKGFRDKLKLLVATFASLATVSLPFALLSPFSYLSTFTNIGSRGPWETVWALLDGFFSTGGIMHSYFDKFFYQFNFLKIYSPSPYDNALYSWRLNWLPDFLTLMQILAILLLIFAYMNEKMSLLQLSGLLYIAYIFFFKGYSTQFSVSTQFFVLLASSGNPLTYLIPVEIGHIMQILSWSSQSIALEFLRNEHLELLVSGIMLRSVVLAFLLIKGLTSLNYSFEPVRDFIGSLIGYLGFLRSRKVVAMLLSALLFASLGLGILYNYSVSDESFRTISGSLNLSHSEASILKIDGLEKGDYIMVKLLTNNLVEPTITPSDTQIEEGTVNPINLEGSFNQSLLFFRANSSSYNLALSLGTPNIPFRVTNWGGNLDVNMTSENSSLIIQLHDMGTKNGSMIRMAYPIMAHVGKDFNLTFDYQILEGNVSKVWLDVYDDTDQWVYTFNAPEGFVLTSQTKDINGHSNLLNDQISLIAFDIFMADNASATIRLNGIHVGGGKNVILYAQNSEEVSYEVFIQRDFRPSIEYMASIVISLAFVSAAIYFIFKEYPKRSKGEKNVG